MHFGLGGGTFVNALHFGVIFSGLHGLAGVDQKVGVLSHPVNQRPTERPDEARGHLSRTSRQAIGDSSVALDDTNENQSQYPQPSGRKPGRGVPVMGIMSVLNHAHARQASAKTGLVPCGSRAGRFPTVPPPINKSAQSR